MSHDTDLQDLDDDLTMWSTEVRHPWLWGLYAAAATAACALSAVWPWGWAA